MGVFFFYYNRKPRKFNHTPILYNPEEEERKKKLQIRIEKVKREMGVLPPEEAAERKDFKTEFVSQTRHMKKRMERKNSFFANNRLLVIILAVIFAISFFLFLR